MPEVTETTGRTRDPLLDEAAGLLLRLRAAPDDAAARAELDGWRAQSARHAEAWAAAQRVWRLAGDIGPAAAPPKAQPAGALPQPRRGRRLVAGAIAALAACLLLAALPMLRMELQADYATAVGETRQVALDDGSMVQLDSDSAIAVDYSDAARAVRLLSGRAFFAVMPDQTRPFAVHADEVAVTVTGTAFDVDLAAAEVRVAVESGAVRVDYSDGGQVAQMMLAPGDRLRIDRAGGGAILEPAPLAHIASWRRGRLLVEGATVAEVVAELRRYHAGMILLTDEALARRRVTGVFELSDPARALRAVVEPHAGEVREITPYLLFVSGG